MKKTIILGISIIISSLILGGSFLLVQQNKQTTLIKSSCIDSVIKEMKQENSNMETRKITNFRIANDRGCFIEAGCMDVRDDYFKPKFEKCNNGYYYACLGKLKKVVEGKIEQEKLRRINECVKLYVDSNDKGRDKWWEDVTPNPRYINN